jgi:hypothetical protein
MHHSLNDIGTRALSAMFVLCSVREALSCVFVCVQVFWAIIINQEGFVPLPHAGDECGTQNMMSCLFTAH